MYVLLFFSLLAVLFTYIESKGRLKNGMAIGFAFMTIIATIRFDYGNDYMNYYRLYNQIISCDFTLSLDQLACIYREPGWTLMNLIFKPFGEVGFFILIAVLAIFQNVTYYKLIRTYVPPEYRWFAVYVYLFNISLYVLNMSMLRQGLTITIFIYCIPLILKKKWLNVILIFLIFSTIHSSIKLLLPFAFWGYLKSLNKKFWLVPAAFMIFFMIFVLNRNLVDQFMMMLLNVEEIQEYGDIYIKDSNENSFKLGLGFIVNSIPFIASLLFLLKSKTTQHPQVLVALACVSSIISPFGQVTQMITRIAYYFQAVSVITIPIVYYWFKPFVRNCLICVYILIMQYSYWVFFHSPIWFDHYYQYTTLFSIQK